MKTTTSNSTKETSINKSSTSKSGNNGGSSKPTVTKKNGDKKSWKKPKDMPKRPLSAYNIFFQHQRKKIVKDRFHENDGDDVNPQELANALKSGTGRPHRKIHGMIGFVPLARQIASDWKTLAQEEKEVFQKQASVEQQRYRKELDIWRKKQEEKKQLEEKQQAESVQQQQAVALAAEEVQKQQQVQQVMTELIKQQQESASSHSNSNVDANAMMQQLLQQQQQNKPASQNPTSNMMQDHSLQNIFDGCNMEEFGDATFFPVDKPAGAGFPSQPQNSLLNHVMAHNRAIIKANAQSQNAASNNANWNNASNNNNGSLMPGWPGPSSSGDSNPTLARLLDASANNNNTNDTSHLGLLDLEADIMSDQLTSGEGEAFANDMMTQHGGQSGGNRATPQAIASMQNQLDQLVGQINFMISTILNKNQTPGQQQQAQAQSIEGLNLTSV